MHGPAGPRAGLEDAEVPGAELERGAALHLDGGAAGEHHEELVHLDVGGDPGGVLPDADGEALRPGGVWKVWTEKKRSGDDDDDAAASGEGQGDKPSAMVSALRRLRAKRMAAALRSGVRPWKSFLGFTCPAMSA